MMETEKPRKPNGIRGFYGEPDGVRTCDLLIKSQLLYQLSYGPSTKCERNIRPLTSLVNSNLSLFKEKF